MATKYWISNTPSTWGTSASWSPAGVPASTDDVVFANGYGTGDCTVSANASALTIAFSGYTGAFTTNSPVLFSTSGSAYGLEIYGNNVNASGSADLIFYQNNYIRSRGFSYSGPIQLHGPLILKDNAIINSSITNNSIANNHGTGSISGATAGINISMGALINTGDTSLIFYVPAYFNGSTSISTNSGSSRSFAFGDVTINAGGTVNFSSPVYLASTNNLFSLNVDPAANTNLSAVTSVFNGGVYNLASSGNPITFGAVDVRAGTTLNCQSAIYSLGGLFYNSTGTSTVLINGSNFYSGSFGTNGNFNTISGTSLIVLKYGGIFTYSGSFSGIYNNILIDCGSNTLTFGSTINYRGSSIIYSSGTIAHGNATLNILSNATISSGTSCQFWNVNVSSSITLSAELYCVNTLAFNYAGSVTVGGTGRFNTANLSFTTPGSIIRLTPGPNHLIRTNMNSVGLPTNKINVNSSIPGTQATLTLAGTQSNAYLNGTDIDSSLGNTVWTFAGTITNTNNWAVQPPVPNTLYKIFF